MKSLKILYCGCLISLLGCAGSEPAVKHGVDTDDVRARSSQAFDELDEKQAPSVKKSAPKTAQPSKVVEAPKASLTELLSAYACPNTDDLRGLGIADNANSALTIAQKEIAAKIQSVVVAKTEETRQSKVDADGNELLESSFKAKTQVITRLQNAQDARPIVTLTQSGKYGVVACMQRSDAAKPFLKEAGLLQDSVMLASKIFEEQKHPMIKNDAFKTVRDVYVRSLVVLDVLDGLGVQSGIQTKSIYESVQKKYNDFRSQFAFYYQEEKGTDATAQQRRSVFERISLKYPVHAASCTNGLLLKLNVTPAACVEKSLGISCTVDLSLSGSSCEGESYFTLNAKVKGNGRYDAKEAQERLDENISNGEWFNDWITELDKWRLK